MSIGGQIVQNTGDAFSLRDSNNKLITYRKGTTVIYSGELYEVTKNVFGQLPDKSSSFVKITNVDDNVIDGGDAGYSGVGAEGNTGGVSSPGGIY